MKTQTVIGRFLRGALVLTLAGTMQSVVFAQTSPDQDSLKQVPAPEKQKEAEKPVISIGSEAVYSFSEEVSAESVKKFTDAVEQLHAFNVLKDSKEMLPIRINLNSPGGDVFAGFAFVDEVNRLRSLGHHVTIATYGMAASAAGIMLQAADTRIIGAHSWVLVHEVSSGSELPKKLTALKDDLQLTAQLWQESKDILMLRSKLTEADFEKHCHNSDWWIPAQQALALGLVDNIEQTAPYSKGGK